MLFLSRVFPIIYMFKIVQNKQCVGAWQSETSWFSLLCEKTLKIPTFPHMWYLVKNQRIFYYLSSNTAFLIKMKWIYLWFFKIFQSGNSAIRKLFSIQHSVSWNVIYIHFASVKGPSISWKLFVIVGGFRLTSFKNCHICAFL